MEFDNFQPDAAHFYSVQSPHPVRLLIPLLHLLGGWVVGWLCVWGLITISGLLGVNSVEGETGTITELPILSISLWLAACLPAIHWNIMDQYSAAIELDGAMIVFTMNN